MQLFNLRAGTTCRSVHTSEVSGIPYIQTIRQSFLKRYNLTSGRITQWVKQLQEYDLKIVHIKGTENFFADVLSRNPIGLSQESRDMVKNLRRYEWLK
jgi:hypothetical protein